MQLELICIGTNLNTACPSILKLQAGKRGNLLSIFKFFYYKFHPLLNIQILVHSNVELVGMLKI